MKVREAVILAGGLGTRLNEVVPDRPKPMAEINGRPFLEYLLVFLAARGMERMILSVGYRYEMIRDYFGNHFKNTALFYAVENTPMGTGGGIRNALDMVTCDKVFIINGDTFFRIPLSVMEDEFNRKKADMVLALHPVPDTGRYGSVFTGQGGRILRFAEKQVSSGPGLVNGGIYLMKKDIFSGFDIPVSFSLEKDFLERYTKIIRIFGIGFDSDFIDIGIPETYLRAAQFFRNEEIAK